MVAGSAAQLRRGDSTLSVEQGKKSGRSAACLDRASAVMIIEFHLPMWMLPLVWFINVNRLAVSP